MSPDFGDVRDKELGCRVPLVRRICGPATELEGSMGLLWSGDYASQHKGNIPEDVIQTLAQTCAERLRHEWEKN